VACVIELNARFDEERNLHWSRELEKVGAHVMFGVTGLKTHSKAARRPEDGGVRSYAHVATGNYHTRTARLYEDVGLLGEPGRDTRRRQPLPLPHRKVAHAVVPDAAHCADAHAVAVCQSSNARSRITSRLPARIVCKMNQLEDRDLPLLAQACRQAPIDLIVRGFCCLAPGVPGVTENIESVRSSAASSSTPESSTSPPVRTIHSTEVPDRLGDWMHRNLSGRVEAAVPIVEGGFGPGCGDPRDLPGRPPQRVAARPDGSYVQAARSGRRRTARRDTRDDDAARARPARRLGASSCYQKAIGQL
jgi:polyphosphate kinase